jgi:hypothetical protein
VPEYNANAFALMQQSLAHGSALTLTPGQLHQVLSEVAYLIDKANERTRLNYALAERCEIQSHLLSRKSENPPSLTVPSGIQSEHT